MPLVTVRKTASPSQGRHSFAPSVQQAALSTCVDGQSIRCRLLAAALLVPALPIIAVLVVLIRLTSPGPGIFRQVRVGLHGRRFMMYKLRTMRIDAEAATGPVWSQENDPRVTPLGRILRRLHLDELPQLFNALKGEMALVGPRPERPEFVQKLACQIPDYLDRLKVRPGITGLAQINLPPDTDLESVRRKLTLDLEYIERGSLHLDLRIFLATVFRLFHLRTAFLLGLLGLHRRIPEQPLNPIGGTLPENAAADAGAGTNILLQGAAVFAEAPRRRPK